MSTTVTFDAETLRRAMEGRDAAALSALYAEDARMDLVDRDAQPSNPRTIQGRAAISAYLDDICGREMTHKVDRLVVGQDSAAFLETCTYPDGTLVRCAAVLDLKDDLIVKQSGVQAWDE